MYRDHTRVVTIGNKKIGGGNPILIQSMTNTRTEDVEATVAQILELEKADTMLYCLFMVRIQFCRHPVLFRLMSGEKSFQPENREMLCR